MNTCVFKVRGPLSSGRSSSQRKVMHASELVRRRVVAALHSAAAPKSSIFRCRSPTFWHPKSTGTPSFSEVLQGGGFKLHCGQQITKRSPAVSTRVPLPAPSKVTCMNVSSQPQTESLKAGRQCRCQARLLCALLSRQQAKRRSSRMVRAASSSSSDAGMDEGPSSSQANCDVDTVGDALLQWKMARMTEGGRSLDWGRYHLQVMFVDRYHMVRARLVEGLFTRIASWNGAGLALQPHSSGIDPAEGDSPPSRLLEEAGRLRIGQYILTEPATRFQRSDLDMHDMIVAVDIGVRDEIMRMVADESPDEQSAYGHKVRLLMDFANYGSASNLEDELAELMESALPGARSSLEIERPYMREWAAWRSMVAIMVLSCSGLVRFLLDQYPDDLPDYDPVD